MDPAAAAAALVSAYLRSGGAHAATATAASSAAAALHRLLAARLGESAAMRALEVEASNGLPRPLTTQHLQLDLADALRSDPSLAAQVQQLVRRAQAETTAGGTSTNRSAQRLELQDVTAGRDIHNEFHQRSRNTKIAVGGGGVLLALVLLFVCLQFSNQKTENSERTAYQAGVLATCARIRDTGTFQAGWIAGDHGFYVRRSELERDLAANLVVVQDQTRALLARPTPPSLAEERAAVSRAAARLVRERPKVLASVHQLPRKVSSDVLQSWTGATGWNNTYRELGDALTVLAGASCSIEVRSPSGS